MEVSPVGFKLYPFSLEVGAHVCDSAQQNATVGPLQKLSGFNFKPTIITFEKINQVLKFLQF